MTHLHVIVPFERTRTHIAMFCCQGPIFLAQYLALCDSAIEATTLVCPAGIAIGVVVLLLCPVSFLMMATLYVRRGVRTGALVYEENPNLPSFSELKVRIQEN